MRNIALNQKTMLSTEIVKIINELREEGQAELLHKNFMVKVVKVLGEEHSAKFLAQYKDTTGRTLPCYALPKREAHLMVMSENYKVQAAVYDRMVELEQQSLPPLANPTMLPAAKELKAALLLAKMLGLKGNQATIAADRAVNKCLGISPLKLLEVDLPAENNERILTPTEIGTYLSLSGKDVNLKLALLGLQIKDANGFWKPTDKGDEFCVLLDTGKKHGNGMPIQQLKWKESILDKVHTAPTLTVITQ